MSTKKYKIQNSPFVVPTTDGKLIEEHFGQASDGNSEISIAHMVAPANWKEPFQTPEFDEYTYIIKGKKQFIIDGETIILEAGQSIKIEKNTRVQYSNPFTIACEYLSVCTPAFSIDKVNRED
ncbi:cupin domain-containing protein [Bizionia paragorgiae]|uniref:Cupin domain-containing protein n=1 Tax=Bizionia paragorgiae TaxID=283786 RepID=A0A1H3ZQQ8_BIZPA|nr:cupin domain-containing protein [Bizionia paragorgiae]MDX1271045.1 cupin domain-containing protein [Bizionia paragorgiae]SEA25945.1 Cupin domain-containing protein [Bizionia paragorgiae]